MKNSRIHPCLGLSFHASCYTWTLYYSQTKHHILALQVGKQCSSVRPWSKYQLNLPCRVKATQRARFWLYLCLWSSAWSVGTHPQSSLSDTHTGSHTFPQFAWNPSNSLRGTPHLRPRQGLHPTMEQTPMAKFSMMGQQLTSNTYMGPYACFHCCTGSLCTRNSRNSSFAYFRIWRLGLCQNSRNRKFVTFSHYESRLFPPLFTDIGHWWSSQLNSDFVSDLFFHTKLQLLI